MAVAFGRYELLKKIASGGMGQVFLARTAQQGFQKLVVIKRVLPHLVEDEEFFTMFFDEARIAARLNHPHLVQIFELGEEPMPYLAMEYVAGDDVRRVEKAARKQGIAIPLGVACRIISDAAAGLDYAHKVKDATGAPLNLIHRDVSPQNILVGFDGGVKLIDFGVARAAGRAQHTATGILKGKYPYMSPEQIAGLEYDHRSDQFALAIVFWEILTGRRLFKGDSDLVTMRLVRECNVPAPSNLNPQLPHAVDAVVLKALSPNPKDRYPDCGALRMAIEDFIVQQRLPAGSAHLSAFMGKLYQERIERESDISQLDELSGPSAFDDDSGRSDSRASRAVSPPGAGASVAQRSSTSARTVSNRHRPGTAPNEAGQFTQPLSRVGDAKRGFPLPILIAGVVLLAGGVAAVPLFLNKKADLPPAPVKTEVVVDAPAPTPAPTPTPVPTPTPEAPKPVHIQLVSTPDGAQVTIDGQTLGQTPLDFALQPGSSQAKATFTKSGYEPHTALLTADAAPTLAVELKKKRAGGGTRPSKDGPPLGIKTGR